MTLSLYKVLLQYYSVLHSTTPVLLYTTKYYSSTTLCYTVQVLRQPRQVTLELPQVLRLPPKVTLELPQVSRLQRKETVPSTWLYYYFILRKETIRINWRFLLLDGTYYWTIFITWLYYDLTISWRFLLLENPRKEMIPIDSTIAWRFLSCEKTRLYLTIPITGRYRYLLLTLLWLDDSYYWTIPITWIYCLMLPIPWRFLFLDDSYYLTLLWTIPITWLYLYLTIPITWRLLEIDDSYYLTRLLLDSAMSFVYRKFLNLNFKLPLIISLG